ncbi:MAG: DUF2807 domain-containing protein [Bacteroidales bacterium]|nr:DUF2807 domain-containing protein [Bacteroidales bacterium]MCF8403753.1 DUF2807 domain-containing protein [Bacteroidales bacterium]
MNAIRIIKSGLLLVLIFLVTAAYTQQKGNKNVVTQSREVDSFNAIDLGGAMKAYLEIGEPQSVKIETDENFQEKVKAEVSGNVLRIKTNSLKNPTKLIAYITAPEIVSVNVSGASDIEGKSMIEGSEFTLKASGAASADLKLNVKYLETEVSGAADVHLSGTAETHKLQVSGAGDLSAKTLVSTKAVYSLSGASSASLNVTDNLVGEKSGVASLSVTGNPVKHISSTNKGSATEEYNAYSDVYYDSVKVKVGGIRVEVYEGDDSVRVVVGDRELRVDDDGNVRFTRHKIPRFNGHWAGFDLGINGYLNSDNDQSFPPEYEYMDLRMTKSMAVYVNFFEQNVALSKNQKWGLVTGLGLEWHNYRFSKNTRLNADSSYLIGYVDQGISIRKSKLTTFNLAVPLLFEFQTNSRQGKNSFHIATGMVASARLSSHTKKYYDERNKTFDLTRYNAETGMYESVGLQTSPDYSKAKSYNDFYLQPFKFDATVRVGWGFVNLFATYSVNEMFKKDKGPELYPWTIGITFVNF